MAFFAVIIKKSSTTCTQCKKHFKEEMTFTKHISEDGKEILLFCGDCEEKFIKKLDDKQTGLTASNI